MKKLLTISLLLFIGMQAVFAQNYSPDRPGIGNGSSITPQNMLGLETGLEFSTSDFVDQFSVGQFLLRYGVSDDLEFRAFLGSYNSTDITLIGSEITETGFSDMTVGAKYNLISGNDKPTVSALANISLPVGSDTYTKDEVVPSLNILADHSLTEVWSISSNLGYTFGVGNLDDMWLFTLTPAVSFPANEGLGAYFGYAGMYYGDNANFHWLEGGLTLELERGAQLDINLGYETEEGVTFIGAGFAKGF